MRVSSYTTSLSYVSAATARRVAELLVEPAASLSERYPDRRHTSRPDARVIEGEVLPRPARDDVLLNDFRARVLVGQAETVTAPPASTADTSGLLPASVAFYRLHASTESLLTAPTGQHVNQYV